MTTNYNNANLTALNKGLTSIDPSEQRIRFAPKLAGDIRVLLEDKQSFLTLNTVDSDGIIWVVSDIDGWWNLAEPDMPNIQRGWGDGSFDVRGRFNARDLTLTGSILISDYDRDSIAQKSASARSKLISAFNLIKRGTWLIVDEDKYKRCAYVRLSGKPDISSINSKGRIDFSIGLRAANPIKYEWVTEDGKQPEGVVSNGNLYNYASGIGGTALYRKYDTSGVRTYTTPITGSLRTYPYSETSNSTFGNFTVVNNGTSNVYCYLRYVGPAIGPIEIKNVTTDKKITILANSDGSQVITDYQFLDIDTYNQSVHLGDYYNGPYTASSRGLLEPLVDWIYLQPGNNDFTYIDYGSQTAVASSKLEVYWRSGWIG